MADTTPLVRGFISNLIFHQNVFSGFLAEYITYLIQDLLSQKVVDVQVLNKNQVLNLFIIYLLTKWQVGGPNTKLEVESCRRPLEFLEEAVIEIG